MAWQQGERVGPYVIDSQLGQGGMATVYKAHHPQLDRHVAIKVMHQNFLEDESFHARFQREAQIVAKLEHPHIVPVYDFSEHEGQPYLVMKFVPGKTLKEYILKRGALDLDDIVRIMSAVSSALSYAHKKGVLHRDIKPSNIVIDEEDTPYLTDFGLARIVQAGESTMSADMLLGTPNYISPEQARGKKNLDARTDLYSLGVVLYELVVGRVPFTADTPFAIIHDHIYTPLPMPTQINPAIPPALEAVLLRALAKQPADRYADASELMQDFKDAIEEANLKELSPDRVSVASVSLARLQEEREAAEASADSDSITPMLSQTRIQNANAPRAQVATGSVPATGTGSYQTAMVVNSPPSGRIWSLGGCGVFLALTFLIIGILLSISNNLVQIAEISARQEGNLALEIGPPGFGNLVDREEIQGVMVYVDVPSVPPVVAETVRENNPDDPAAYLILARMHWERDNLEQGERAIRQGLEVADAPERPNYLLSAARLAEEKSLEELAIVYTLLPMLATEDNPDAFARIRPLAGQMLYDLALEHPHLNLPELMRSSLGSGMADFITLDDVTNTDSVRFYNAVTQFSQGNLIRAQSALNLLDEAGNRLDHEMALLQAQVYAERNTIATQARARVAFRGLLDAADSGDDVPAWVVDLASEELDQLN